MHETSGGLAFQNALGRGAWLPSMHWEVGRGWLPSMHWEGGGGLASQHALGRESGVGFPACTGKGRGWASQHALGRGRGCGFPACIGKVVGFPACTPELGKAGDMYPAKSLWIFSVVSINIHLTINPTIFPILIKVNINSSLRRACVTRCPLFINPVLKCTLNLNMLKSNKWINQSNYFFNSLIHFFLKFKALIWKFLLLKT